MRVGTGSYTGSGAGGQSITGLGFQPVCVFVQAEGSGDARTASWCIDLVSGSGSWDSNSSIFSANAITSLDADGFSVGGGTDVNRLNADYSYLAFGADSAVIETGTYTGNGVDGNTAGTTLSDIVFAVVGRGDATGHVGARLESDAANVSHRWGGDQQFTNQIKSLGNDITLGNSSWTNQSGITFYYVAFNNTAAQVVQNEYTGDGGSSQSITGVGFQPKAMYHFAQLSGADAHHKWDVHSGNTSYKLASALAAGAAETDRIQTLDADGFTVGNDVEVNTNSRVYPYVCFRDEVSGDFSSDLGTPGGIVPFKLSSFQYPFAPYQNFKTGRSLVEQMRRLRV